MATRIVEWKKPYTWWKAIEITEDKVINLRLRSENNLIIYDSWDNEIYVDLQLPDELRPTDAFPVWITTGRAVVDNWWDKEGTIVCFKTTSGDNIKLYYTDEGKVYIDNWTWTFKQIYLKWEVDTLLQNLQSYVEQTFQEKLTAWFGISIDANNVISSNASSMGRFLSLWDCETWEPISFPADIPFVYQTWDHYLIDKVDTTTNYRPYWIRYDGTASTTVETEEVAIWDEYFYDGTTWLLLKNTNKTVTFSEIAWQPTDNTNLATALNAKADTSSLATVATTWDYDDLSNKPTIPSAQVNSDWNASSGVAEILNKPTIPTDTSDLTNGAWYITGISSWDVTTALWYTPVNPSSLWTASACNTGTSSWNVPVLDSNWKLNKSTLPWVALTDTYTVSTSSDLTSLSSAEQGDLAIVTTENKTYVLATEPYSTAWNWKEILTPTGWVTSVNSQTWAVTLDADDISDSTTTNKFVTANEKSTWSGKQDALTLPATPTQWNLVTWWANNKSLVDWWAIPTGVPSWWNNGDVLTNVSWTPTWQAPSGWGWDVLVSSQANNILTSWMKIWAWTSANYWNLWTYDSNTLYLVVE